MKISKNSLTDAPQIGEASIFTAYFLIENKVFSKRNSQKKVFPSTSNQSETFFDWFKALSTGAETI